MKGASATQVVVSLALGIAVIVGLGYLVWTWMGKGGGTVSETYCNSRKLAYCTQWSASGFASESEPGGGWSQYSEDCSELIGDVSKLDCENLLKV